MECYISNSISRLKYNLHNRQHALCLTFIVQGKKYLIKKKAQIKAMLI